MGRMNYKAYIDGRLLRAAWIRDGKWCYGPLRKSESDAAEDAMRALERGAREAQVVDQNGNIKGEVKRDEKANIQISGDSTTRR